MFMYQFDTFAGNHLRLTVLIGDPTLANCYHSDHPVVSGRPIHDHHKADVGIQNSLWESSFNHTLTVLDQLPPT